MDFIDTRKEKVLIITALCISFLLAVGMFVSDSRAKQGDQKAFGRVGIAHQHVSQRAMPLGGESTDRSVSAGPALARPFGADEEWPFSVIALFQTHDQSVASAVILHEGYGAFRYRAGDLLAPGVVLLSIQPDHVLVGYAGEMRSVYLDQSEHPVAEEGEDWRQLAELEVPLTDEQQRRKNILEHFDLRPVSPVYPAGYIIGDKFPEESARASGVSPGDVLMSVNGYPVGEPGSDHLAWISFQRTQRATVVIQRGGSEIMLYYPEDVVPAQQPQEGGAQE